MTLTPGVPQPGTIHDHSVLSAATRLYEACQLPAPAILVARDPIHFVRLVRTFLRPSTPGRVVMTICLGILLVVLLMSALSAPAREIAASLCTLPVFAVPVCIALDRSERGAPFWQPFLHRSASILLAGVAAAASANAWQLSPTSSAGLTAAIYAMVAVSALLLAGELLAPVRARWGACAYALLPGSAVSRTALLRGSSSAAPLLQERLRAALAAVAGTELGQHLGAAGRMASHGGAQRRIWTIIHTELRRSGLYQVEPVIGASAVHGWSVAAGVGRWADATVRRSDLPRILQAAVALDDCAEAVCPLDHVAVVLPRGAPVTLTVLPAPGGWRRSRRLPWQAALQWLDEPGLLAVALDLAPTDPIANRLLAARLRGIPEPARRTPALQAFGVARAVAALRLRPVHVDSSGRLFHFGQREAPSAFVAVRDSVVNPDGSATEHWISVPPHVATAREAVAWTFGRSEAAYQPGLET